MVEGIINKPVPRVPRVRESELSAFIAKKHAPGSKLKIVFRQDCLADITHLLFMIKGEIITVESGDHLTLIAIIDSKKWGCDANRTVVITLTEKFNEEEFVSRLANRLESIEVVA